MRKLLIILATVVIALGLFSPAEAAPSKSKKKSYSVSLSPKPTGTQRKYNDTSLDLSSATAPINTKTTIRGKLKGGNVKGKKVYFYATNMHSAAKTRQYLGSDRVSKSGYFTKRFAPKKGYAGTYKIQVVKKAGAGRRAKTKTFYIRVNEWVSLSRFFDASASTPNLVVRSDREPIGPGKNEYWSTSYALAGGGTAVFNINGFRCRQFNLKIGVSQNSTAGSTTYTVGQSDRVLMSGSKSKGGGFDEPTRSTAERINPNVPFMVSNTGDPSSRLILGLPKAACMMPYKVAAVAW